jgi:hypothetical protein
MDEEAAFWMMIAMCERINPHSYRKSMVCEFLHSLSFSFCVADWASHKRWDRSRSCRLLVVVVVDSSLIRIVSTGAATIAAQQTAGSGAAFGGQWIRRVHGRNWLVHVHLHIVITMVNAS